MSTGLIVAVVTLVIVAAFRCDAMSDYEPRWGE